MYYPSLEQVRDMANQGNLVPVYREIVADLETPVSAFAKIARGEYAFLLESVEGGERLARYSFIGVDPFLVLRGGGSVDPLKIVEAELAKYRLVPVPGLPRFHGGAVGYLAYECVRHWENLPAPEADSLGLPEAIFMFSDTLLVFDHVKHRIKVLSHAHLNGDVDAAYRAATERIERLVARLRTAEPVQQLLAARQGNGHGSQQGEPAGAWANLSQAEFEERVVRAKEYIYAGDIIQVVPSRRISRPTRADPFTIYRALRTINPSPYMFYLHLGDCHLVGASPEILVRVEDGTVNIRPLAGTRRRGVDEKEDAELEAELRADAKERAEHIMLLDLGRNDVGRVSVPGTVKAIQVLEVERYSHVMHLSSHVVGRLRPDLTPFDALRSGFPAGTVSGAPKIRAMEIIAELEPDRRGPYAGCVGYFSYSGNMDTAIALRTMVIHKGVAHVQAGGGIVADSVPAAEFQETMMKSRAMLNAIDDAEAMEAENAALDRQLRQLHV